MGFAVLLSGTSVYNEILRTCLPPAEPRPRRRRSRPAADAEAGVQEPLLQGQAQAQQQQAERPSTVRFAEVPASQPIAAGRAAADHARYTMARRAALGWQAVLAGLMTGWACTAAEWPAPACLPAHPVLPCPALALPLRAGL